MTKPKSAEEIQAGKEARKQVRREELEKLILVFRTGYKASKALGVTPSAIYERMKRVELARKRRLIPGEPTAGVNRKVWWTELLATHGTIKKVAKAVGCSVWTVQVRFKRFGIIARGNRGVEPVGLNSRAKKVRWLKGLLVTHGNAKKVAEVLGCTPSAVYERMGRYGLKKPV
jgi:hypothetical protein